MNTTYYHYLYKDVEYSSWWEIIKHPDFKNVSFCEDPSRLTDEELAKFGITRVEVEPVIPDLDAAKERKLQELKATRNERENLPVTTDKGTFDFDAASRTRITNAIASMSDTDTREWTTADNQKVQMTKADFNAIRAAAAERSDIYHQKWLTLKAMVLACQTVEEVNAINWDIINSEN